MRKLLFACIWILMITCHLLKPAEADAESTMFTSVSSQLSTTLALDAGGHIWAWGSNLSGQFGEGTTNSSSAPKRITVTDNGTEVLFKEVKASYNTALALDQNGNLWSAGTDGRGQLGLGAAVSSAPVWTKISVMEGGMPVLFKKIALSRYSAAAIDQDGLLWVWGFRTNGAGNYYIPTRQPVTSGGSPVTFESLEMNDENGIAIDSMNNVWNIMLQLINPSMFTVQEGSVDVKFKSIAAGSTYGTGYYFNTAIDMNGNIWTWGWEAGLYEGQLGDGQPLGASVPAVSTPAKISVSDNGSPVHFEQIAAGRKHVLALDEDGNMWAWGRNTAGQLGDNSTVNTNVPHKVPVTDNGNPVQFSALWAGYDVSYGLDVSGRLWSWGTEGLLGGNTSGGGMQKVPKRVYITSQASLAASVTASTYLQPVTLTASIAGDLDTPTGAVEFMDGAAVLGSGTVAADGTAQFTASALQAGIHSITAQYKGDDTYLAHTSEAVHITVSMPPAPFITITPSVTANTYDPVTLTVTAQTYGSGNTLTGLKWLPGNNNAAAFASAGSDILADPSFEVGNNGTYTVYAKDLAGNTTVQTIQLANINSVLNPATTSFDKYAASAGYTDVITALTLNGNTLNGIANGAAPLIEGTDYAASGSTVTISKSYLQTLPIGRVTLTFAFSGGVEQTLTITITDSTPRKNHSSSTGSSSEQPAAETELFTIVVNPSIGIVINVDSSALVMETTADGTSIQKLDLPEHILDQVAELLKDSTKATIIIKVADTERSVQVQLPGASVAAIASAFPGADMEVELRGSSLQLKAGVIDLEGIAKRLGVAVADLKIVTTMEQVHKSVQAELERLGTSAGFRLAGSAVDFHVRVETVSGKSIEIRDLGGTYMARAIVYDASHASGNVIAVHYDPFTKTVSYIPTHLATRDDGRKEAVMKVPHYSIYAVIDTEDRSFADMNGHWAKQDVELLASKLIINGVTTDRFLPDDSITRAEFVSLLVRAMGLPMEHDAAYNGFADVACTAWYAPAVETAVTAGLVNGVTADRFEPTARITREQMVVIITRSAALVSGKLTSSGNSEPLAAFTDHESISSWAQSAVTQSVESGIITGMDGGRFEPQQFATRAQAATMLKRLLLKVGFID